MQLVHDNDAPLAPEKQVPGLLLLVAHLASSACSGREGMTLTLLSR
jgi:hypothetical protein